MRVSSWQPKQMSAKGLRMRAVRRLTWGLWQVEQSPDEKGTWTTGLSPSLRKFEWQTKQDLDGISFRTGLPSLAAFSWHISQEREPKGICSLPSTMSLAFFEACGLWQAVHSPSKTLIPWCPFAMSSDFGSWQPEQSSLTGELSRRGLSEE